MSIDDINEIFRVAGITDLEENSMSANPRGSFGGRTNPILKGYAQSAPSLVMAKVGSRMNEINAFAMYHGYDARIIREIAEEAIKAGRVPNLTSRLPDTYDRGTVARFISDAMLELGESKSPKKSKKKPLHQYGSGSDTALTHKTAKDYDTEDVGDRLSRMATNTGSKFNEGVDRDTNMTYVGFKKEIDPLDRIEFLRKMMGKGVPQQVEGVTVFPAQARQIVEFHDKLGGKNQTKFQAMDLGEQHEMALKFAQEAINPMWRDSVGPGKDYAKPKKGKTDDGKGLDPVGHGDADIDNDGDSDSSDRYLKKRRKAIGKAIKSRKARVKECQEALDELEEGVSLSPDKLKGRVVRTFVIQKAKQMGAQARANKGMWAWGESGEEDIARAKDLIAASRKPDSWWALHYHQYLHCCPAPVVNKLAENDGLEEAKKPSASDILRYLKGAGAGESITVASLVYSFKMSSAKARSLLQGMVKKGQLKVTGEKTKGKGASYALAEMDFRDSQRELRKKVKSGGKLSTWEKKVLKDLKKNDRAFKALQGKKKSYAKKDYAEGGEDSNLEEKITKPKGKPLATVKGYELHVFWQAWKDVRYLGWFDPLGGLVWKVNARKGDEKQAMAAAMKVARRDFDDISMDESVNLDEKMQYHHVRVRESKGYDKIRTITFGKGIKARIGVNGGPSQVLSMLFPKDQYSFKEAKAWVKKHDYKIKKAISAKEDYAAAPAGDGESEDPFLEMLIGADGHDGNLLEQALGVNTSRRVDRGFVSPLHALEEERVEVERKAPVIEERERCRDDEIFDESNNPFANRFNGGFWGAESMSKALRG